MVFIDYAAKIRYRMTTVCQQLFKCTQKTYCRNYYQKSLHLPDDTIYDTSLFNHAVHPVSISLFRYAAAK